MGFRERVGRFDDESVIYRTDDPEQKVHLWRVGAVYLLGSMLATALIAGAGAVGGEAASILAPLVILLSFLVVYVMWRRRRNRRLTGSPTTWPSETGG